MVQGLEIPFNRVTYRDGQLLTAGDMQADHNRNSRLWDLHTRYLHNTWGIAIGFSVSANKGDSLVQIGPGYAVDLQGRPLVSSQTVALPVPLVSGTEYRVLVINYQSNSSYREQLNLDGACLGSSTDQESPVFEWKAVADVQVGLDVPLITLQLTNGVIQSTDARARRYAQKLQRPYIAAGATDQGSTVWSQLSGVVPQGFTMYQTTIDTSDGAFNNAPYYFAELHMWSNVSAAVYGVTNSGPNKDFIDYGGPFTFMVSNQTSNSFTFRVIVPSVGDGSGPDPNVSGWSVSWLGVEVASCEPKFTPILNILLNFTRRFPKFPVLEKVKVS
jgi:hypothetical protein